QPYDWRGYLQRKVYDIAASPPLEGITGGGYRLAFTSEPTKWWTSLEKQRKQTDLTYSGGLVTGPDGKVVSVLWDSPAFNAGIALGNQVVAVNSRTFSPDDFKQAIRDAAGNGAPVQLLVKDGDLYRTLTLDWHGGLRYPRLEKVGKGRGTLDMLLAPR